MTGPQDPPDPDASSSDEGAAAPPYQPPPPYQPTQGYQPPEKGYRPPEQGYPPPPPTGPPASPGERPPSGYFTPQPTTGAHPSFPGYAPPPAYPGQPSYAPQAAQPTYAGQPGYPGQPGGYAAGYPGSPPAARPAMRPARPSRIARRPDPKYGVSLAGIGVLLAITGVVVWAGDYLSSGVHLGFTGSGVSDSHRLLGIGLSLVVMALGYALTVTQRTGPLTTAGVVATALGIPILMGFLTFDPTRSGGPFQLDALVLVSVAVWVVSCLAVPGARGHSFYLGLATTAMWLYVLDKSDSSVLSLASAADRVLPFGTSTGAPDFNTIGAVSLIFGAGYYLAMAALDQTGRAGAGTPFAVSGFAATVTGILAFSPHAHTKGTAVLFIAFGVVVAWLGARSQRRFTTWVWAFAVGAGIVALVSDSLQSNAAGAGIVLIVVGIVLVGLATVYTALMREPVDDPAETA